MWVADDSVVCELIEALRMKIKKWKETFDGMAF